MELRIVVVIKLANVFVLEGNIKEMQVVIRAANLCKIKEFMVKFEC